jgi:hypothetical protein
MRPNRPDVAGAPWRQSSCGTQARRLPRAINCTAGMRPPRRAARLAARTRRATAPSPGRRRRASSRGSAVRQDALYKILRNRTYLGEAVLKGRATPASTSRSSTSATWDRVHEVLLEREAPRHEARARTPAPLRGWCCTHCESAMTPTHTRRRGRSTATMSAAVPAESRRHATPSRLLANREQYDSLQRRFRDAHAVASFNFRCCLPG